MRRVTRNVCEKNIPATVLVLSSNQIREDTMAFVSMQALRRCKAYSDNDSRVVWFGWATDKRDEDSWVLLGAVPDLDNSPEEIDPKDSDGM